MTDDETSAHDRAARLVARAYSLKSPEQARALYRDWAATYDATMTDGLAYASPRRCADLLARHLAARSARILDIGCGTGLAGRELARHGFTTIDGIDLSPDMLKFAAASGVYATTVEADVTKPLAMATARYGGAICTGTFTHAHVGAECLDEIVRVLAPGAVFAFTVHLDVLEPAGFAAALERLERAGELTLLESFEGAYYDTSEKVEGRYYAWRRR